MTASTLQEMLTGCLYGRSSAAVQKSIGDQLTDGRRDAERENIRIVAEYDDGRSASWYATKVRDDWAKVLDDIEARRWDVLILWEASRGDRSPDTWAYMLRRCRQQGIVIRIIRDGRTYDPGNPRDLKSLLEDGLDAMYESEKTSARVRRGVAGAVEAGTPLGRAPLGYARTKDARGKVTGQVPDENAGTVRRIFADVAKGVPMNQVVRELNAAGLVNGAGKPWTAANVRDTLRCLAYVGLRRSKAGGTVKGGWDAIIEDKVFFAVQRRLDARKGTSGDRGERPGAAKHLLSSIARCEVCDGPLKHDRRRAVYMCKASGHVAVKAAELDDLVTRTVLGIVSRPDVYARLRQAGDAADREVAEAENELARLEGKLAEARDAWEADRLSLTAYTDMEARLAPKIKDARQRSRRAGVHPAVLALVDGPERSEGDVAARWEAMPLAGRRDAIRALMTVTVHRGGGQVQERVTLAPV